MERLCEEATSLKQQGLVSANDAPAQAEKDLLYTQNYTIRAVTQDSERFQFNTSIARMMEFLNAISKYQSAPDAKPTYIIGAVETLTLLFAPFAPHFCEEQWERFGNEYSVFNQKWPEFDPAALILDEIEIAVQINGQVKFRLNIASSLQTEEVEAIVKSDARLPEALAGREIVKFIYVKGRLANIVAK